jgi:hypothetical protein
MSEREEKKSRIYKLMDSLSDKQAAEFMSWARPRLTWYADANIEHSESQLDEIIAKLEEITEKK